MNSIIIDDEFKSLIPPLGAEERSQLEENIKADGCRDPLVVWRPASWKPEDSTEVLFWDKPTWQDHTPEGDEYRFWDLKDDYARRHNLYTGGQRCSYSKR